jgi:hypothetical protein
MPLSDKNTLYEYYFDKDTGMRSNSSKHKEQENNFTFRVFNLFIFSQRLQIL